MSENEISKEWAANEKRLRRQARGKWLDDATADDVVQDVYLVFHEGELKGKPAEEVQALLSGILRNKIADRYRDRTRKWKSLDGTNAAPPAKQDPEHRVDFSYWVTEIAAQLDTAPRRIRQVLQAQIFYRDDREAMRRILNMTEGALVKAIHDSRKWLSPPPEAAGSAGASGDEDGSIVEEAIGAVVDVLNDFYIRLVRNEFSEDSLFQDELRRHWLMWREVISATAALLQFRPPSVQFAVYLRRYVSPRHADESDGKAAFRLKRPGEEAKEVAGDEPDGHADDDVEYNRVVHPVMQRALAAWGEGEYAAETGDDSSAIRHFHAAWVQACRFPYRDKLEQLALTWFRRAAMERVVWRLNGGRASEDDLAVLLSCLI